MADDFVFKSSDIRLTMVDGSRTGEKNEQEITLAGADLSLVERRGYTWHKERGVLDHRRPDTDFPMEVFFSWRYANADIYLFMRDEDGADIKSTSAPGDNLCTAPYDYSDPAWTKNNVTVSDDGVAPDGQMIAKRLTPSVTAGNIVYSVTYSPALNEWTFVDFWVKAETAHQARASTSITYHGSPPTPPAWLLDISVTNEWQKITTGIQNLSTTLADETLTLTIWPTLTGTYSMDLWEVYIRRDVPEVVTHDLYIDVYDGAAISRRIVIEDVKHRDINFVESELATIWSARFDARTTEIYEIVYD